MTELEKGAIAQAVREDAQAVYKRAQAVPEIGPKMADLLVAYLNQLGVEYVFGVPGGAIEPLYDALARSERRGGVRAVVAPRKMPANKQATVWSLRSIGRRQKI